MKKYWFVLDTYVFLWEDSINVLVYNTLSSKSLLFKKDPHLVSVVKELINPDNLHVIELTEKQLEEKSIRLFVTKTRNSFCGELYDQAEFPKKPIVIVPCINLNDEVERDREDFKNVEFFGQKVSKNLLELRLYWGGGCSRKCDGCEHIWKQIRWCMQTSELLEEKILVCLLKQIQTSAVDRLSIFGRNLFMSPLFEKYYENILALKCLKNLSIDCHSYETFDFDQRMKLRGLFDSYTIFVDTPEYIDVSFLEKVEVEKTMFQFRIESELDFEKAQSVVNKYQLLACFIPYYNRCNINFFETFIYQDRKTIMSTSWSKKDIFSHMYMNANFFGHLTILPNGDVYSDYRQERLGSLKEESLSALVYGEMKTKDSWRLTRDLVKPCGDCLYRYLCPPISNYEREIGKFNLCHL